MSRLAHLAGRMSAVSGRFRKERGGNVAVLFGLAVIPLAGLVGLALDYNRAVEFRGLMMREADAAALSIASADAPNTDKVLAALRERVSNYYGDGTTSVTDVSVSSSWVGGTVVTVSLSADLATTISGLIPGAGRTLSLAAQSSAKRKPAEWQWSLPTVKDLSYEAGDYNRISVYCYDETKKTENNKGRRTETLVAISDNGGTDYSKAKMPACNPGETLSYQLRNVRNSRTNPSNWDKPSAEHYLYFTDTKMDPNSLVMINTVTGGREAANGTLTLTDLTKAPILETILCDTATNCKNKAAGGILPNNNQTNRIPAVATEACSTGKSMYYGWEDRPPTSAGSSDKDYDDIRIVVTCPVLVKINDKEVRIVK